VHALADLQLPGYRDLLWRLVALCVSALVLATAGMLTQHMCRVDPPRKDDDDR
jgi:hypothetical protein